VRVGDRQHAFGKLECQTTSRQKTQASWHERNPSYLIVYRIDQRAAQKELEPEALRLPAPLTQLPWTWRNLGGDPNPANGNSWDKGSYSPPEDALTEVDSDMPGAEGRKEQCSFGPKALR
jgi:hypothetical protein